MSLESDYELNTSCDPATPLQRHSDVSSSSPQTGRSTAVVLNVLNWNRLQWPCTDTATVSQQLPSALWAGLTDRAWGGDTLCRTGYRAPRAAKLIGAAEGE